MQMKTATMKLETYCLVTVRYLVEDKRASRVSLTRALATLNVASAELGDGKQVNSQIELF